MTKTNLDRQWKSFLVHFENLEKLDFWLYFITVYLLKYYDIEWNPTFSEFHKINLKKSKNKRKFTRLYLAEKSIQRYLIIFKT